MKILICGSIAIDTIIEAGERFDNALLHNGRIDGYIGARNVQTAFGGCAGNIAYNLKQLGEDPIPVAAVGHDFDAYARWLARQKIASHGIRRIATAATARAFIINDTQGSQISTFHAGAMTHSAEHALPDTSGVAMATISPDTRRAMILHAEALTQREIPILFDPGQASSSLGRLEIACLASRARWIVANETEWRLLGERGDLHPEEVAQGGKIALVTRGREGITVYEQSNATTIGCAAARADVDTTGCGDALRAGFIHGLGQGFANAEAARIGAAVASFAVETQGPQAHRLNRALARERFERSYNRRWPSPDPARALDKVG